MCDQDDRKDEAEEGRTRIHRLPPSCIFHDCNETGAFPRALLGRATKISLSLHPKKTVHPGFQGGGWMQPLDFFPVVSSIVLGDFESESPQKPQRGARPDSQEKPGASWKCAWILTFSKMPGKTVAIFVHAPSCDRRILAFFDSKGDGPRFERDPFKPDRFQKAGACMRDSIASIDLGEWVRTSCPS